MGQIWAPISRKRYSCDCEVFKSQRQSHPPPEISKIRGLCYPYCAKIAKFIENFKIAATFLRPSTTTVKAIIPLSDTLPRSSTAAVTLLPYLAKFARREPRVSPYKNYPPFGEHFRGLPQLRTLVR